MMYKDDYCTQKLVDDFQTSIDISEKSKGIYFLKINSDNGSKLVKVIKE